ncbi:hypothetical protein BAZOLSSOX_1338 [uncultured Gammaproteobacteria bacterium]|nr:hypothetical protein [uncultured Gammaproteobacteria bacterium]VVH55333.1 hypothetical protein BAZOLSSOX_1338 [uncultured Gammaproteobacteria bacterium]
MAFVSAIHHHTGGLENSMKWINDEGQIHHHTGGLENFVGF